MPTAAMKMARWLRDNRDAEGRIRDPVHGEHGEYADGFAALVFGLLALRTGDGAWAEGCRRSLEIARRRPAESEFDSLARLLLAARARAIPTGVGTPFPEGRLPVPPDPAVPLYTGRRLVSHNWVAMRALCYSLRAELNGSNRDGEMAGRLWDQVLSWQLGDGLFLDSPGGEASPVAYHAKFCVMLALALDVPETRAKRIRSGLERGLRALERLVSPAGVLVPFGRSRDTLFGYAAAIAALRRGAVLFHRADYLDTARRLEQRLQRFQQPDGHVPAVLNAGETERADWDVYINNPDYNAYAAALLLLAEEGRGSARGDTALSDSPPRAAGGGEPSLESFGTLLIVRQGDYYAAFSTRGQSVPLGTPFFCDHRYYGMQPLWIERAGQGLFAPAPYRWRPDADRRLLTDPPEDGWIPWVETADGRFCVRRYDRVEVRRCGPVIEIMASGCPELYVPVPAWQRAAHALACSVTGRPGPVCSVRRLDGVRLRRRLRWDARTGSLRGDAEVEGQLPPGAALHQESQHWSAGTSAARPASASAGRRPAPSPR